jgi:hypothetical protein
MGAHNPMSLDRFEIPPDGDMLQRATVQVPALKAYLAQHSIGLRIVVSQERAELLAKGIGLPNPVEVAAEMRRRMASLSQPQRRQAMDNAGLSHISAAPIPLGAGETYAATLDRKLERKRSSMHIAGVKSPRPRTHFPDWHVWSNIPQAEIWQAVALTLDIDPDFLEGVDWNSRDGHEFDMCSQQFKKRLLVATANARANALPVVSPHPDPARAQVRLTLFHEWACHLPKPWRLLPAGFPRAEPSADQLAPVKRNVIEWRVPDSTPRADHLRRAILVALRRLHAYGLHKRPNAAQVLQDFRDHPQPEYIESVGADYVDWLKPGSGTAKGVEQTSLRGVQKRLDELFRSMKGGRLTPDKAGQDLSWPD